MLIVIDIIIRYFFYFWFTSAIL